MTRITPAALALSTLSITSLSYGCEISAQDPKLCEENPSYCRLAEEKERAECALNGVRQRIEQGFELQAVYLNKEDTLQAQKSLAKADKDWRAFRDSHCYSVYQSVGGRDAHYAQMECEITLTELREKDLDATWRIDQSRIPCNVDELAPIRRQFLAQYQAGDYDAALTTLEAPYKRCQTLPYQLNREGEVEKLNTYYWYISDLMLARRRTDDLSGCLRLGDELYAQWGYTAYEKLSKRLDNALTTNHEACEVALEAQVEERFPYVVQACPVEGYEDYWALPAQWRRTDWKGRTPGDEIYHELACIRYQAASKNEIGGERDGPKTQTEGVSTYPYFETLYVRKVDTGGTLHYETTQLYWDWSGYCFDLDPSEVRFGAEPGQLRMSIGAGVCQYSRSGYTGELEGQINFPSGIEIQEMGNRAWR
ncbi:lysozyme inhibitor LprI family protein [Vibrio sp. WXL103]|uniref:lysozyme inhibitor LprI family protein n=1 Tax=Vibrio sp. WXL103 TaxID=3450710 RepID=UPI003EC51051